MRFVMFYHSLVSDWNHGNAHFLRGVCRELLARGHSVRVCEPVDGWSRKNLIQCQGKGSVWKPGKGYEGLEHLFYGGNASIGYLVHGADVVIAHEWTDPSILGKLSTSRVQGGAFQLFFHDTHHRAASEKGWLEGLPIEGFDGVLAYGDSLRFLYERAGWNGAAWTWHEAADTQVFFPHPGDRSTDAVWIGNWGDEERSSEIQRFFLKPLRDIGATSRVYGVRYPDLARKRLRGFGAEYLGWVANYRVPEVFAQAGVTVHIPRRPYLELLPGIPTIRVFEALACGIPLITARWREPEDDLFSAGEDFLVAESPEQMKVLLREVLNDDSLAKALRVRGLQTVRRKHTCGHRVEQLLRICGAGSATAPWICSQPEGNEYVQVL